MALRVLLVLSFAVLLGACGVEPRAILDHVTPEALLPFAAVLPLMCAFAPRPRPPEEGAPR